MVYDRRTFCVHRKERGKKHHREGEEGEDGECFYHLRVFDADQLIVGVLEIFGGLAVILKLIQDLYILADKVVHINLARFAQEVASGAGKRFKGVPLGAHDDAVLGNIALQVRNFFEECPLALALAVAKELCAYRIHFFPDVRELAFLEREDRFEKLVGKLKRIFKFFPFRFP